MRLSFFSLAAFFVVTFAVAAIGSFATMSSIETWYMTLNKPALNPPNWVFGPVWTLLYAFMAVAAWRVYQSSSHLKVYALAMYAVQLLLNLAWSFAFFRYEHPLLALQVILALLFAISITAVLFYRSDRLAGILFVPYILWVSFATYLNAAIVSLN